MDYEQLTSYKYLLLLDVDIQDYSRMVKNNDYMLVRVDSLVKQLIKDKINISSDCHELLLGRYVLATNIHDTRNITRLESYLCNKLSRCISQMRNFVLLLRDNGYGKCLLFNNQKTSKITISLSDIKDMVTILGYSPPISINDIDVAFILLELINLKDGEHLFRGVSKIYDNPDGISSSNYRNNKDLEEDFPDLQNHEKKIAEKFNEKHYAGDGTYINALSISRHLGYGTSFIDFTEDPMVALYFACQGIEKESATGEIIYFNQKALEDKDILKKKREINYPIGKDFVIRPTEDDLIKERVRSQKSIFVYACMGYLCRDKYKQNFSRLLIDPSLKSFLLKKSGLREDEIYPDKMGFFDNRENFMTYQVRLCSAKMKMKKGKPRDALHILVECQKEYGSNLRIVELINECKQEIKKEDSRRIT